MTSSPPRRARLLPSIILCLLCLGSGSVAAALLYSLRKEPPRKQVGVLPPLVRTHLVEPEAHTEKYVGYGSAAALRKAQIASEVTGQVVEVVGGVRAGSSVLTDQVLVRIDDRDYRQQLRRVQSLIEADGATLQELTIEEKKLRELLDTTQSEMRSARSEWLRVSDLYERDLAAKKEYDSANAALQRTLRVLQTFELDLERIGPRRRRAQASKEAHQAELARAALAMERCAIKAPFDGTLDTLAVELGDWLAPGMPVATLVDTSRVEVGLQLPALVRHRVTIGSAAVLRSESQPDVTWRGSVARISPTVDQYSRTFMAYVTIDNETHSVPCVPGSFVRADVYGPTHVRVLLIPRGAVRDGSVLVAEGDVARSRAVRVMHLAEDRAVVAGEIEPGDVVVLTHLSQLDDGSPIRIAGQATAAHRDTATPADADDARSEVLP